MTKLIATAYKPSGKFYAEEHISHNEDIPLYDVKSIARLLYNKIPFLEDGYIHIQDEEGGEGFHNHLFTVEELKGWL